MSMIHITLPDGTINEYAAGITCAEVIVDALGKKHGCLAAKVDGSQFDLSHVLSVNSEGFDICINIERVYHRILILAEAIIEKNSKFILVTCPSL